MARSPPIRRGKTKRKIEERRLKCSRKNVYFIRSRTVWAL